MNDTSNGFSNSSPTETGAAEQLAPPIAPSVSVNLNLPIEVVDAIDQFTSQSGQSQTQVILAALRSGLGLQDSRPCQIERSSLPHIESASSQDPVPLLPSTDSSIDLSIDLSIDSPTNPPTDHTLAELEVLKARLADLETLIPKVAALEGKSIAF